MQVQPLNGNHCSIIEIASKAQIPKVSQLPKYTTLDSHYSETNSGYDSLVYGISTTTTGSYHVSHEGWVGVTTYMGTEGELRVKKEVLVAMSGINTATNGFGEAIIYPTQEG